MAKVPSIPFLRKVERGDVYRMARMRLPSRFVGGEATAQAHADAGYIKMPYIADLGRPSHARLTDAGRAVLSAETPTIADPVKEGERDDLR